MDIFDNEEYILGVHATHCCSRHGCKYAYTKDKEGPCPVETGKVEQEKPCEYCKSPDQIKLRIRELQEELEWARKIYSKKDNG